MTIHHLSPQEITSAVNTLKTGGVIAFPTETVYGLGCDPRSVAAVERVFTMKDRNPRKPLLLVAGSWEQVEMVAHVSADVKAFAQKYWPGALTLVLPLKQAGDLAPGVALNNEVSIRYSSSSVVHELTKAFGFPIIATSANRSGEPETHSAKEVRMAGLDVDMVLDGGVLDVHKPSTVARINTDGSTQVFRQGEVVLPPRI